MTSMNFDITAQDSASREFLAVAQAAEKLEDKLRRLDKMTAEPKVDLNIDPANRKLDQLQKRLDALKNVRTNVELDGADKARKEVSDLVVELRKLRDTKVDLSLTTGTARKDVQQISDALKSLRDAKVGVTVDVKGADKLDDLKRKIDELKLASPVKIRVEVENAGALSAFAALGRTAKSTAAGINGTKANFQPGADPSKVLSALGQIRGAVAAAADDITKQNPKFRADMDASSVLKGLKQVESAVQSTAGKIFATKPHMQATADVAPMLAALQRAQAAVGSVVNDINGKKPTLKAGADVAPVLSALSSVESSIKNVTSKTHTAKVKVDTDEGGMSRLAKLGVALASLSPLAVAAGGASTAAVASLGGAIASAVPIAVAGLGMLGGTLLAVEVATNGVGAAFAAFRENDMKKFEMLLGELSANGKSFTLVLTGLYSELKRASGAVQDQMFARLDASLRSLGQVAVPMLIRGMGGVATELNKAAKEAMGYLGSAEGIARQTSMWVSTRQVVANLAPAFTDVIAILSDLGEVGGRVLADVSGGVGGVTQRWREWIAEARNSGRLEEIMRGGVEVFAKLGSIIGNTGSILGSFYRAATAAGSDFLTTLDRGTEAAARFLKSAEGQNSLVTFFRESRAAIDNLMPGLESLGRGVMEAIRAFGETGGLSQFGAAVGQILTQVGNLLGPLGTLAGNTLKTLANAAALAAQALDPIVTGLVNLLNAMGPVGPALIAMVVAFNGLAKVNTAVTGLGASMAGMAAKVGVGEAATTRIAGAFSKMGSAIPVVGAAIVGLSALYDEFGSKADQNAAKVINGSQTLTQAIAAEQAQLEHNTLWWNSAAQKQAAYAQVAAQVTEEFRKQYAALSPYQKLTADVAMAQLALNDAIARFGPDSQQARDATDALAAANLRKKAADEGATTAAKTHAEAMRDQVQAAQQLLGSMLAVEDALNRATEAEKAANQAVKEHGAGSDEAKAALNDYAQAADSAAQAIAKQAGAAAEAQAAGTGAAAETRAYGAALLTMAANASGPAQSALLGYISKLTDAQLAALSAGSEATGFATKIMQLPDGRTVKIAVDPETGKIVSTQQLLDAMQKTPVMIKIGADTLPANQAFQQVLKAVQEGKATVNIDGQNLPALEALAQVGRQAGLENATVNIGGQSMPAQAVLSAFITSVQTGNPMVNINGQDFDARAVFAALQSTITAPGTNVPIGATTAAAEERVNWLKGLIAEPADKPVDADVSPAQVRITDMINYAQQPATKPIEGNPAGANAANAGVNTAVQAPATKPMNGNPADANAKNAGVNAAVQQPATKPMNGNPADANAKNSALNRDVGIKATKPIDADTNPAKIIWEAFKKSVTQNPISTTITTTITRIFQTIGQAFAEGGILPMATGGVLPTQTRAYAGGGADEPGKTYDGHRLTSMSGNRAAVVQPKTYRVIGDNQRVPEVYIPLNGSQASLTYTGYAANEQGYALTPINGRGRKAAGGTAAMASGGIALGSVSDSKWKSLRSQGWRGIASDGMEKIYAPGTFNPLDAVGSALTKAQSSYSGSMPISFAMAAGGTLPYNGGPVKLGSVSDAEWKRLRAAGWRGIASDNMEALYAPGKFDPLDATGSVLAAAQAAAGGGGGGRDEDDEDKHGRRGRRGHHRHHRRRHHRHHRRHGHGPSTGPAPSTPPSTGPAPTTPPATTPPATGPAPTTPPAVKPGTTYTTSQVSTTQPLVQPAGSTIGQPPASSTPGGAGAGIDLSGLIAEVKAVKAAVLSIAPNDAGVISAVTHLEQAVVGDRRGGHGYRAQCRRSDGELSRI